MRIQHNIMAMGAYRNYTNNLSAMQKNLEKLSSGYKINRAGDDAAGLAISEKMRAQITGLETAQKNAKDGISLIQTAEGALTEVHDMLNRMVELATQSANGTYDDTTDRDQLQKEVEQLRTEIDRIADSANFNGIKLLNGDMEEVRTIAAKYEGRIGSMQSGVKASFVTTNAFNYAATYSTNAASAALTHTVLHKDGAEKVATSFEIKLENVQFAASAVGTTTVTLTIGSDALTSTAIATEKPDAASGVDGVIKGDKLAEEIYNNYKSSNYEVSINSMTYTISVDGDTLKFEMTKDSLASATTVGQLTGNFDVAVSATTTSGKVTGSTNLATQVVREGTLSADKVLANTSQATAWTAGDIEDGMALKVGNETYVFAMSDATATADWGEGVKIVDIRDISEANDANKYVLKTDLANVTNNLSETLTRLTQVAKDNDMFTVGLAKDGTNKLTFQERNDYSGDADLSTIKGLSSQFATFKATGVVKVSDEKTVGGRPLTLQIGDTAEDFNQLKVSIKDCHSEAIGVGKISIADQASAQKAIDAIKNAINYVSDVRGTLGATQNRLDHTINNLSVMTENIQDAESTIRDTDVAAEMMAYTKNNILIQSAQAMLAQANQVPQGVLQLLQ